MNSTNPRIFPIPPSFNANTYKQPNLDLSLIKNEKKPLLREEADSLYVRKSGITGNWNLRSGSQILMPKESLFYASQQPRFHVIRNGTALATNNVITYTGRWFNDVNCSVNLSTGKLTIQVAGRYIMFVNIWSEFNGTFFAIAPLINGIQGDIQQTTTKRSTYRTISMPWIRDYVVGDTVEIYIFGAGAAGVQAGYTTSFSGMMIG